MPGGAADDILEHGGSEDARVRVVAGAVVAVEEGGAAGEAVLGPVPERELRFALA